MNCDQRTDSIYLFAVGALPDGEADDLRRHLATGCPACAGLLAEAQAAAALIPLANPPAVLPPGLKARVMDRIDRAIPRSDNASPPQWAVRLFRLVVPAAVAAGIAVVVTHFVMNRRLIDANHQLVDANLQTRAAVMMLQRMTAPADDGRAEQLVMMLQSPGVRLIPLQPTDQQPTQVVANLLYDVKDRKWAMVVRGMKPAGSGQTYELWFVTSAGPRKAGLFDVDAEGSAALLVDIPPELGPPTLSAVTNEKAGGSDSPKGQFQLKAPIQ